MDKEIDGHEAYRDDPAYTAPEMEPGNGEDVISPPDSEMNVVTGTGMTGGIGGGALAGEAILADVEEERAELTPTRTEER
jgi:hypothetical protein